MSASGTMHGEAQHTVDTLARTDPHMGAREGAHAGSRGDINFINNIIIAQFHT